MNYKKNINTKNILSFTLIIPIFSLVTITILFIYILNNVENDLFKQQQTNIETAYNAGLDELLKARITQANTLLSTLNRYNHGNNTTIDKEHILKILHDLRFDKDGYLSVYDLNGTLLTHPIMPYAVGQNFAPEDQPKKLKTFNTLKNSALHKHYFTSKTLKPSTNTVVSKRFYASVYAPYHWILATGVYKDAMKQKVYSIQQKAQLYFQKKKEKVLLIIFVVVFIVLIFSLIMSNFISRMFKKFAKRIAYQNNILTLFNQELTEKVEEKTQALQKSENRFRTILKRSKDPVFLIEDKSITYANEAAVSLFECHSTETLKEINIYDILQVVQNTQSAQLLQYYLNTTNSLGYSYFKWKITTKNDTLNYLDIWLQSIEINDKKIILATLHDVTVQKQAEDRIQKQHEELLSLNEHLEDRVHEEVLENQRKEKILLQQSRLAQMGEMISMIAHQWRQPLSAISTTAANLQVLIALNKYEEDKFNQSLAQVENYVSHLSDTINDFRNFFKPDKEKKQSSLVEIAEKSLQIITTTLETKNITLHIQKAPKTPLTTYTHEVMQVILNLIKNAEDILEERAVQDPTLTINFDIEETHHSLHVLDNAGGIAEDILDKIFDPYFSTKSTKNGTGLGLYMSKVIINDHCNGKMWVSNTDNGAKFTIKLPAGD